MTRENFTARPRGDFLGSSKAQVFPDVQQRSHGPENEHCPDFVACALPSRGSEARA